MQMVHEAPNLVTVLEEFKIFIENAIFVAHPISFDYKFINESFKKYNLGELYNRRICSISLSTKIIKTHRYGLKYLKELLNINIDNHHRAYSDAVSTSIIFNHCLERLPQNIKTSEDLISFTQ
jgi:DNA polymerase-3 subunit epsilon